MNYFCSICNKSYKNYNSLYKHNKRYHTESSNGINCLHCGKFLTRKDGLSKHQKTCKEYKNCELEYAKQDLKTMITEKYDTEIAKKLLSKNIDVTKVNNGIIGNNNQHSYNDSIFHSNNQTNSNNQTQNINVIVNLGDENLSELLTAKQQIKILNQRNQSLEYIIKYIHFNKDFPQFQNIMIDDLKSKIAYTFDSNKKDYVAIKKDELIDDLIENRLSDIEEFYTNNVDEIKQTTKDRIRKFVDKVMKEFDKGDSKYIDEKKKDIELLMFNEKDIVKENKKKIKKLKLKQS
jgi:hypothetical protein